MKILLDTNVLISALIFGGQTGALLNMLFESEHEERPLIYSPAMMLEYLSRK